jgi:hypothetical protein
MAKQHLNDYPQELEIKTADLWLEQGTIHVTETGSENTYYTDQFGTRFFCKNNPCNDPDPIQLPEWISADLSPNDIAAVNQGGCESGSYLPAVEYYTAAQTMAEYGDDVLDYLQEITGELPKHDDDISWGQMAVFYLSRAVELFCACHEHLADWENENPIREAA